jgi:hypothetical protein
MRSPDVAERNRDLGVAAYPLMCDVSVRSLVIKMFFISS